MPVKELALSDELATPPSKPLEHLSRRSLSPPGTASFLGFDPAAIRAGIVHLGPGNFHRAHMARYTHALMAQGIAQDWGIVGAGLLSSDRILRDALAGQDWLYTLVERDGDGARAATIGALCEMVLVDDYPRAVLDAIDGHGIRIVSLTVTDRGYCFNSANRRLDLTHPMIAADLRTPDRPRSAIGTLAAALDRRRQAGRPAFTALSCDNIQHNGDVLRRAVLDFADVVDPSLAKWIATTARFPNGMVDRITPRARPEDAERLARQIGWLDAAPVFCEPFTQWVIEDDFSDGRPDWDLAGAQFVRNVAPYERMKLRLLNASHLAIAGPGALMGYGYVHEAISDPALRAYIYALMKHETGATLDPIPDVDFDDYSERVLARFINPTIGDTLQRINDDAPLAYLLDPVRDQLASGNSIRLLALAIAAWLIRTSAVEHALPTGAANSIVGKDGAGVTIDRKRFGALADDPVFVRAVTDWLRDANMGGQSSRKTWTSLLQRAAIDQPE